MFDLDKWQEIYISLSGHKLRTALTAFGVFWGIFMLVVLLGMGKGLENNTEAQFGGLKNAVFVFRKSPTSIAYDGLGKGRTISFNDEDVAAIRETLNDIALVVPGNKLGAQYVVRDKKNDSYNIDGAYYETLQLRALRVVDGRFINKLDGDQRRKVAIIGTRVRDLLFPNGENYLGEGIKIKGVNFKVIGVFESITPNDGGRDNPAERIYLPNQTLRYTFNQRNFVATIVVLPKVGVAAQKVEQEVEALLKARHRIHPQDPAPIGTFNVEKQYQRTKSLFTGISTFSWLVAIGTIIAGVIGVGNIMLIVVKERTKEIGLRKALGATPFSIVTMIVQESMVITIFSGYMGLVLGVFSLEGIGTLMSMMGNGGGFFSRPEISFATAISALLILVFTGALAALLPASKAAKVDPVLALQQE